MIKNIFKKLISMILIICIIVVNESTIIFSSALENVIEKPVYTIGEIGGYLSQNAKVVKNLYDERNFIVPNSGSGYALEQAMSFHDILRGNQSILKGSDNLENGPDRVIINKKGEVILIQDKLRTNPTATVREMFNQDGSLRYIDKATGKPMLYEVPKDQYDYVVNSLKDRIANNKVPGITDPNQAEQIVRKAAYTTKQIQNIAKAGTVDSLVYDAQHGVIYSGSAMGVSFVLDFVACKMNGYTNKQALYTSSLGAMQTGSVVFATYVISSQLAKTSIAGLTNSAASVIVNSLSDDIIKQLAETYGIEIFADGAAKAALKNELNKKVTQAVSKQILTSGVLVAVLTVPDIIDIFKKRISPQQLLKNLTVTMATVVGSAGGTIAGGAAGSLIGGTVGSIVPGAGNVAGAAVGSTIGKFVGGIGGALGAHALSESALNKIYKGDADKMYAILTDVYKEGCIDFMLTGEEAEEVANNISNELTNKKLKDMYASEDRKKFAEEILEPTFLEVVCKRQKIEVAKERDVRKEMKKISKGIIYVH